MSTLVQGFGIAVRQSREARGWSQERLAEHSDLNRSYVGEIERGSVIASLATVEKLAGALGYELVKRPTPIPPPMAKRARKAAKKAPAKKVAKRRSPMPMPAVPLI